MLPPHQVSHCQIRVFRVKRLNQANTKTKMNINKSCSKLTTTRKLIQLLLMPKISSSVSKSYKNVTHDSNGCKVAAKITRLLTRTLSERHFFYHFIVAFFYDSNILKAGCQFQMSCQPSHCQQVWLYSALKINMKTKTRRLNFKRQQNNTQKEQNIYITNNWTDRDPHLMAFLYSALPWNVYSDSCKSHVSFTMATALCLQLLYCMTTWKENTRLGKSPKGSTTTQTRTEKHPKGEKRPKLLQPFSTCIFS